MHSAFALSTAAWRFEIITALVSSRVFSLNSPLQLAHSVLAVVSTVQVLLVESGIISHVVLNSFKSAATIHVQP